MPRGKRSNSTPSTVPYTRPVTRTQPPPSDLKSAVADIITKVLRERTVQTIEQIKQAHTTIWVASKKTVLASFEQPSGSNNTILTLNAPYSILGYNLCGVIHVAILHPDTPDEELVRGRLLFYTLPVSQRHSPTQRKASPYVHCQQGSVLDISVVDVVERGKEFSVETYRQHYAEVVWVPTADEARDVRCLLSRNMLDGNYLV